MTAMRLKRYPSPSGGFALGKMGVGATMLEQGKTARDYVQNGLVALWDGIENAGWGVHDSSTTTWKDLIGSLDITLKNAQIFDDHVYFSKNACGLAQFNLQFGCIEAVLSKSVNTSEQSKDAVIVSMYSQYSGYGINAPLGKVTDTYDSGSAPYVSITNGELFSVTLNKNGATTTEIAKNGVIGSDGTVASGSRYASGHNAINGGGDGLARLSDLWFRCLRVYSRNLTAAEIAANYAIDKERFNLP